MAFMDFIIANKNGVQVFTVHVCNCLVIVYTNNYVIM